MSKHVMLGANIRPGHTPGSFSHSFAQGKTNIHRRKPNYYAACREIKEAANRVLEQRGLGNLPNFQDSTVRGGYSR